MASVERVTVTLPDDLVRDIDRREKNRSRFIADAVRRELERRRQDDLRRSLQNPHPESHELAEQGLEEWSRGVARGRYRSAGRQQCRQAGSLGSR